jgi:hypothetical protein
MEEGHIVMSTYSPLNLFGLRNAIFEDLVWLRVGERRGLFDNFSHGMYIV